MKNLRILMAWTLIFCACTAQAQNSPMENAASNKQIFKMGLYPPDIIMKHQQRLGISDEQRKHISAAVKVFQNDVAELQWTLQNEQQEFKQALAGYKIETQEAMAKAEDLLKLESKFKLAHFSLLFAIKNELTQEQIDTIRKVLRGRRGQDEK